jgi:hypothetical protein
MKAMDALARPRLLLVGRPGTTLNLVKPVLTASGVDVVIEPPDRALAAAEALAPKGVIIVLDRPEDSNVAAALAATAVAPVLALEAPRVGSETAALVRTADAFARQLTKKKVAPTGLFAGLRFLAITSQWDKAEGLVRDLRAGGATIATADPSGKDWGAIRMIEPHVVLLDVDRAGEAPLLDRLRADPVLRWGVHLPFEWDALVLPELSRIVEGWLATERELVKNAQKGSSSASLDAIGVGRAIRALGDAGPPLRLHLTGGDGAGHIDVANGMIVGATFKHAGADAVSFEGIAAIAVALSMEDAALRVEPCERSMPANVAVAVADALKTARLAQGANLEERTDPNVKPQFPEGTVPSLRLMIGQLAELIHDDDPDTAAVHAAAVHADTAAVHDDAPDTAGQTVSEPPPFPHQRATDPDPMMIAAHELASEDLVSEELEAIESVGAAPPPPPTPILSTALPVPVTSAPALLVPALPTPIPPPIPPQPMTQKKGSSGVVIGVIAGVVGVGAVTAAAVGLWLMMSGDPATPRASSAPRRADVPADAIAVADPPPPQPIAQHQPAPPANPTPNVAPPPDDAPNVAPPPDDARNVAPPDDPPPPNEQSGEAWADPLVAARARLRANMTPNDLNRLATPVADVAGARIQSDLVLDRAEALVRQRDWQEAEQQFQEAYLIYPRNPHVSASLAELYLERDRASLAVQWARSALNLRRGRAEYADLLARAEAAAGGGQ